LQGGAARLARQAHNLKVVGSNPTPAPNFKTLRNSNLGQFIRKSKLRLVLPKI
jgi:hypothetical protein